MAKIKARKKTRVKRSKEDGEVNLDVPMNQEQFAGLIGESQQQVSRLVRYQILSPGGTAKEWIQQHLRFQMGIIFGRQGWTGIERSMGN